MIVENVVSNGGGCTVSAKFTGLEWKVLATILAQFVTQDTITENSPTNLQLSSDISRSMIKSGFPFVKFNWLSVAMSMEIEMRQLASQFVGPVKYEEMVVQEQTEATKQEIAEGKITVQ